MATNPYEQAMKKQRTAAALQGASTGASVGGAIGSIIPVVGTPLGAGIGALGGGLIGYGTYQEDILQKAQLKELEDLQRRQEMGALGLTDAERAQLEAELIDPMRASRREQQLQFQQALQGADTGAGSFYKMGIGQEGRVAAQEQEARNKIEASNMAEAAREQARIYELLGEEQKRADAAREANLQSLSMFGDVAKTIQQDKLQEAERQAFGELENSLLQRLQTGTLNPQQEAEIRQDYDFFRVQRYGGR